MGKIDLPVNRWCCELVVLSLEEEGARGSPRHLFRVLAILDATLCVLTCVCVRVRVRR